MRCCRALLGLIARREGECETTGPDLSVLRPRSTIPIVFITARGDESLRPRLLEAGAIECLLKPLGEAVLLDAVTRALQTR